MELTPRIITNILENTSKDIMFILTNETSDEVINEILDRGLYVGNEYEETTEGQLLDILDEEDVIMFSRMDGDLFIECACGRNNALKMHEQDKPWELLIEEELFMNRLLTTEEVLNRLGDAENIDTFTIIDKEDDKYVSNCMFDNDKQCEDCEGYCDFREEDYVPFCVDCEDYECTCEDKEQSEVEEYLEFIIDEAVEDTMSLECKCEDCIESIISEAVVESFKSGYEQALLDIRNNINEHIGQ